METSVSLLGRLQRGPVEADWRRLHALYEPLLRTWVLRAGVPRPDADDLIQETMLVVIQEVANFEHRKPGAFRSWLRQIVANRLHQFYRDQKRIGTGGSTFHEQIQQLQDPASELSAIWHREHDIHLVKKLLKLVEHDFQPLTWQAFRLQVLEGISPIQVAERTGQSINSVLLAKSRILKRLRQELAGLWDG
jgi:RNA polymerase sigma-70 factor, ECF subfamily